MSRLLRTGLNTGGTAPTVTGGQGVHFHLSDGRRVLDGSNTGAPLGHAHPRMVEALNRAATTPMVGEGWSWAGRDQAAETLMSLAFEGEPWAAAVRFCLSGSEANDMALSLAQALTGREPLATRERAYHGIIGLSRALTVQPHWHGGLSRHAGGTQLPPNHTEVRILPGPATAIHGAPPNDPHRLTDAAETLAGTAAVLIDYSQGGLYHDPAYQDAVAEAAGEAGTLWIADEVVTGCGRAGRWFAFQGATSRPDIVTLGKGLAGGAAPTAAIIVSQRVLDMLQGTSWQNYGTLRGHPVAMECVQAYLHTVRDEHILQHVAALEPLYARRLREIAQRHPAIARIAGQGLHWTIELHGHGHWQDWRADTAEAPIASRIAARALELGAVIGTSGERDSLFLAPPLVITAEQSESLLAILDESLTLADTEATLPA
ncbi:aminotransferase class III-fold pyridoxal phosphate-dependent enzyme [Roseomonas sp. WA12]